MTLESDWKHALDQEVDQGFAEMVGIRRHLHSCPEVSGQETQTTRYLKDLLEAERMSVRVAPDGCGLIAEPQGQESGPLVALRADMDALRIQDMKTVPYRSRVDGVMHACGHDAHTAVVMGAMLGLARAEAAGALPWPVAWRGILQPAEEIATGARNMIAAGGLERVCAILALHVDPSLDVGTIGLRTGVMTAACDWLEVRIAGRGGHAARPHESRDPLAAAAQLVTSLYLFVPRAIDSHQPVVLTVGQILGGDNANVIPESAVLRGTLRTLGGVVREQTKEHIRQLVRGIAETSGTFIEVEFQSGPESVVNDARLADLVRDVGRDFLGADHVVEIPRPSMGGEDFAAYGEFTRACMFRLGCRSTPATGHALHSPQFDVDEQALAIGAKMLGRIAVRESDPGQRT